MLLEKLLLLSLIWYPPLNKDVIKNYLKIKLFEKYIKKWIWLSFILSLLEKLIKMIVIIFDIEKIN